MRSTKRARSVPRKRSKSSSKRAAPVKRARAETRSRPVKRGRPAAKPVRAPAKPAPAAAPPRAATPARAASAAKPAAPATPVSRNAALVALPLAVDPAMGKARAKVVLPREEAPKDKPADRANGQKAPPPSKKPKPPAKTMQVPLPQTAPLLKLDLPDVRRATHARSKVDLSRGQLRPELPSKQREPTGGEKPVDATLIMSSLSVDVHPKIEDNYDYSVLEDFRASKHCPPPTRMVNTGCGGGEAAVYFAKLGYKVVGIDSDRTAVGLARERAWLAGTDVDFMVGDLFETPNLLPTESFGLALDRGAFHRLDDDRDRQRYLANVRRLLFQGGVLFLSAGYFPLDNASGKERRAPRTGTKLLLAREGGMVVNELQQAGFQLLNRVLRKTADSGDYGELILYLKK